MTPHDAEQIALLLTEYYGLPLSGALGRTSEGQECLDLAPVGMPNNIAFRVQLTLGWRSMSGQFKPGNFAGPVIEAMGKAPEADRNTFTGLVARMGKEGGTVTMVVNGKPIDPLNSSEWPPYWNRLTLGFEKSPLPVNTEDPAQTLENVLQWGGRFMAAIIALAPLEALETEADVNPDGLPEGSVSRVKVNRYERSPFNRATCIEIHGYVCSACSFDFSRIYGDLGKQFIHVHHVTPVSELGENYIIDPANDLVPLCPNCHAMVHRQSPPLTVEELKQILALHA